jgi:hypothetical protein
MKLFEDGDPFFAPMLNALFAAFRGTAVMSGCEASATGTSRTVSITAGSVQINGEVIAVSAGSVTLDAGSTFDRYDLVSVNASGSKIVTKGATKRKCPTQPANTCLLAIVFVPAGATVVTSGNVYDARLLSQNLAAAAIECAGALQNQTGNIGARTGFVDSPGNTTRKSFSPGTVLAKNETATVATITIPANYSSTVDSNLRITIVKSTDSTYDHYLGVTIKRNGETIGSGSIAYDAGSGNIDTTGGCKAGDTITVEAKNAWGGTYDVDNITIYTVTFKTTRRADIPAYKVFPEAGTW